MYVRFVVNEIDECSGVELGIFQAMYRLWRAGTPAPHEEAVGGTPGLVQRRVEKSQSAYIRRAHEMVALLAEHYVESRMLRSRRAGYVVYEDQFQVAAETFRPEHR